MGLCGYIDPQVSLYDIGCYAEAVMNGNIFAFLIGLGYLALVLVVVYLVVSALIGIRRGVEDIAQTLRRIEARGTRPIEPPPSTY